MSYKKIIMGIRNINPVYITFINQIMSNSTRQYLHYQAED